MQFRHSYSTGTYRSGHGVGQWRRSLLVCLALACWLLSPATARAEEPSFADAVAQFQKGRWSDAYGRFIEMANEGDADAARIALFMLHYGPLLYGSNWDAAPDDRADWQRLAASNQGRSGPSVRPLAEKPKNPDRALRRMKTGGQGRN